MYFMLLVNLCDYISLDFQYLKEKLEVTSSAISDTMEEPDNTGTIQLLLAWRNLILVLAAYKVN